VYAIGVQSSRRRGTIQHKQIFEGGEGGTCGLALGGKGASCTVEKVHFVRGKIWGLSVRRKMGRKRAEGCGHRARGTTPDVSATNKKGGGAGGGGPFS